MKFHVLTLFPDMILQGLGTSITGRAVENGLITIDAVNIRDYTENKHKRVDDYPYGGGAGMLMQAQPVYDAWRSVVTDTDAAGDGNADTGAVLSPRRVRTIYLTPQGQTFSQQLAEELAKEDELVFLCGHYEGIDERVLQEVVTDYVSIGDYVLTGGELPAMVMIDAIARLVPGVLNNDMSAETESFHGSLLEYPQYSRPVIWHEKQVPEVLLSGDHKKIREWRLEQSVMRTRERRPDLYAQYEREQDCVAYLLQNKLLHIDMIELIRRGQAQILYFDRDGVLLRDRVSGYLMITAADGQAGEKILKQSGAAIELLTKGQDFFLASHQEEVNAMIESLLGMTPMMCCYQAVYTRKEPLPQVRIPGLEIRPLSMEHLEEVCARYQLMDHEYLKRRISHGCMYGAFFGDKLAGFAGLHEEGSAGMLEVLPNYRRQGIGRALETFMINTLLEKGMTPYGQVEEENIPSLELQNRMGLYFSRGKIWWLEKKNNLDK